MPLRAARTAMVEGALPAVQIAPSPLVNPYDGAVASFLGVVRDHHGGLAVASLRYDHYGPMAELQLQRIAAEVAARLDAGELSAPAQPEGHPLHLQILHSYGELVPGDVSLVVHAASPHRVAAFAACREVVEAIKRDLPVWKLERYADGGERYLPGS